MKVRLGEPPSRLGEAAVEAFAKAYEKRKREMDLIDKDDDIQVNDSITKNGVSHKVVSVDQSVLTLSADRHVGFKAGDKITLRNGKSYVVAESIRPRRKEQYVHFILDLPVDHPYWKMKSVFLTRG